jgi:hypothetical protein
VSRTASLKGDEAAEYRGPEVLELVGARKRAADERGSYT